MHRKAGDARGEASDFECRFACAIISLVAAPRPDAPERTSTVLTDRIRISVNILLEPDDDAVWARYQLRCRLEAELNGEFVRCCAGIGQSRHLGMPAVLTCWRTARLSLPFDSRSSACTFPLGLTSETPLASLLLCFASGYPDDIGWSRATFTREPMPMSTMRPQLAARRRGYDQWPTFQYGLQPCRHLTRLQGLQGVASRPSNLGRGSW